MFFWNVPPVSWEPAPGRPLSHRGQDGQRADRTHAELQDKTPQTQVGASSWSHLTTAGSSSLQGERGPVCFLMWFTQTSTGRQGLF